MPTSGAVELNHLALEVIYVSKYVFEFPPSRAPCSQEAHPRGEEVTCAEQVGGCCPRLQCDPGVGEVSRRQFWTQQVTELLGILHPILQPPDKGKR